MGSNYEDDELAIKAEKLENGNVWINIAELQKLLAEVFQEKDALGTQLKDAEEHERKLAREELDTTPRCFECGETYGAEKRANNMMQVWRDFRYCGREWGEDCPFRCELHSVCQKMEEAYRGEVE